MWLNLRGLPAVFDEAASQRFTVGAAATTASAVVLLGIAVAHYSFGRRGSRVGAALLAIAIDGSLALPIAARGARRRAAAWSRTRDDLADTVQHVGAASWSCCCSTARRSSTSGRASRKGGCRTSAGCSTAARRWISRRSGRRSPIRSGPPSPPACIRPRTACDPRPRISPRGDDRADRSAARITASRTCSSVSGRPRRAEIVGGMAGAADLVDARRLRHQRGHRPLAADLSRRADARLPGDGSLSPAGRDDVRDRRPRDVPRRYTAGRPHRVRRVRRVGTRRAGQMGPVLQPRRCTICWPNGLSSFTAIRYQGVDTVGHHYLRYAQPRTLRRRVRRRAAEVRGRARSRTTRYIDGRSARRSSASRPAICCWSSPASACSRSARSSTRSAACCAIPISAAPTSARPTASCWPTATSVAAGRNQRGSIVDVTPTILYFLGLPVGRDMDGYARADIFTRAFTAERPITFIPSHGTEIAAVTAVLASRLMTTSLRFVHGRRTCRILLLPRFPKHSVVRAGVQGRRAVARRSPSIHASCARCDWGERGS